MSVEEGQALTRKRKKMVEIALCYVCRSQELDPECGKSGPECTVPGKEMK
jgi:hypothetical protein